MDTNYPPETETIQKVLRYQTVVHGLTHKQLARMIGCSVSSIAKWKAGDVIPTERNWYRLLKLEAWT